MVLLRASNYDIIPTQIGVLSNFVPEAYAQCHIRALHLAWLSERPAQLVGISAVDAQTD